MNINLLHFQEQTEYLNCSPLGAPTSPGTEIKVTPESAVPIISHQVPFRIFVCFKKASLPVFFYW
jgi:hypothetical protein